MTLTLQQMMDEPTNKIHFWRTSTDVIIPSVSPHSYKGTARHLLIRGAHEDAKEYCPRCNDEWGKASNGLRPCLTRGCHTWIEAHYAQTGRTPLTEEDIVFSEFEEDMHEAIRNDIDDMPLDDDMPFDDEPSPQLFDEFVQTINNDFKQKALSDTQSRATQKVNNLSSAGDNMSDPRDIESDLPDDMPFDDMPFDDTPPHEGATHSPQDTTKNMEEQT